MTHLGDKILQCPDQFRTAAQSAAEYEVDHVLGSSQEQKVFQSDERSKIIVLLGESEKI
jgi:hypothetical protein